MFLASLMLANNGNVTLSHKTGEGGIAGEMKLEFHKKVLDLPTDNYLAPSAEAEKNENMEVVV